MGQTLQSGSRASPCRPQREPNWCPGQVHAARSRLSAWPSWLSSAPPQEEGLRLVAGGQCRRARREWESQALFAGHTLPLTSIQLFHLSLSATVSAAVVPSAPIFSPTMGGSSNSSLSLDSGGTEPMPGGYLTPDLHPHRPPSPHPRPLSLCLGDLANPLSR